MKYIRFQIDNSLFNENNVLEIEKSLKKRKVMKN